MRAESPGEMSDHDGKSGRNWAKIAARRPVGKHLRVLLPASVLLVVLTAALFAGILAPMSPVDQDLSVALRSPGFRHAEGQLFIFGTDELGRDVLSRLVYGARPVVAVAGLAVALSATFGFGFGLVAGFSPRLVGEGMMRLADVQLSIPPVVLAILLAILLGPGIVSSALAIAVVTWPSYARLVRAEARRLRVSEFVRVAQVSGLGMVPVLRFHVMRNVAGVFIVLVSFNLAQAIIISAALSFLGYGVQPPTADWGNMLAGGLGYINSWWLTVLPGLAIALTIAASNGMGEVLRHWLDPRAVGNVGGSFKFLGKGPVNNGDRPIQSSNDLRESAIRYRGGKRGEGIAAHVEGLSVHTTKGGYPVLKDVGLEVYDGEIVSIVGESGSGKSTVCFALLGLLPSGLTVVDGQVFVGDHEITALDHKGLSAVRGRSVGAVFQDPLASLDPVSRTKAQITETRLIHRVSGRREADGWARKIVEEVGLKDPERVLRSYPHELSGGMRQRVCIAIARSGEPGLLVADEPTTALDVSVRGQVLRGLLDYRDRTGGAILLVTHDMSVVEAIADRVVVMYGGRVLEEGPRASVLTNPANPYTQALLNASVPLNADNRDSPLPTIGDPDEMQLGAERGCPFAPRCPRAVDRCRLEFPSAKGVKESGEMAGPDDEELELERRVWCWNPVSVN